MGSSLKKHVIIILDGAADQPDSHGRTPFMRAYTPVLQTIVREGFTGLLQTLYDDLPRGSIVAQLGLLGYDPYKYYPCGRASSEAMALHIDLGENDIAFRANLATITNNILTSYNAQDIKSDQARLLIDKINKELTVSYPRFELYHNTDFRNVLIIRDSKIHPDDVTCVLPHEHMGKPIQPGTIIHAKTKQAVSLVDELNNYLVAVASVLKDEPANVLLPWSPSQQLRLPSFPLLQQGKCAIISNMDFLGGIANVSGIRFFKMGNGSWNTDYEAKGKKVCELLDDDYFFVLCHINGPDEASHMGDIYKKMVSIERSDARVIKRVYEYFKDHPQELGSVAILPDHYTVTMNNDTCLRNGYQSHLITPVPFVIWDGIRKDMVVRFNEDSVAQGLYGQKPVNHCDLFSLMGVKP